MGAHIGTAMMLKKVGRQCEEARNLVDNTKIMPNKNMTSTSEKMEMEMERNSEGAAMRKEKILQTKKTQC